MGFDTVVVCSPLLGGQTSVTIHIDCIPQTIISN
jgi:hypothetical protein